jgi:hypothetical protein
MYTHICSSVADFNYLFGVISHKYPNNDPVLSERFDSFSTDFNKSQVKLRFGLINEEIKELSQAVSDKNPIEVIDALCDILYVVAGAKVYFNLFISNEPSMYEKTSVIRAPLTNSNLENMETIIRSLDSVEKILSQILDYNKILSNLTELFVNEQKKEYHKLFLSHLISFYDGTLDNIVASVFEMGKLFSLDLIHFFDIVHSSNMTKICETEEDAKETVEWYKKNELRYEQPAYRKIHYNDKDYYVIYDMGTGKILKSIKYVPAKFT